MTVHAHTSARSLLLSGVFFAGVAWVIGAICVGPRSRRVRASAQCHHHRFEPGAGAHSSSGEDCVPGLWSCVATGVESDGYGVYSVGSLGQLELIGSTCSALSIVDGAVSPGRFFPVVVTVRPHPIGPGPWASAVLGDVLDPWGIYIAASTRVVGDDSLDLVASCSGAWNSEEWEE